MSKQFFPSFNYPFTSSVDLQQSLCDYGRTGPVAVFKDETSTVQCLPQKKAVSQNTMVRLHAEKPSLPIKLPTKTCPRFSIEQGLTARLYCQRNLNNFSTDYSNILYQSMSSLVKDACKTDGFCYRNQGGYTGLNALYSSAYTTFVSQFGEDCRVVSDIPSDTLERLLAESYAEDVRELNGKYYGNCLAYQINHTFEEIILAYPGGANMDKLMLSTVSLDDTVVGLSHEHEAFTFPGRIFQISMENESQEKPLIAVRCDYTCSLFHCEYSREKGPTIKILGNFACKTKPCSVIVNPYIPGEIAVAMETGSVHLWHANSSSLEVVKQCSACTVKEFDWYFCEFGPHPRQIIRGSKTNVELLDLRASSPSGKDLMTLPSAHFFEGDHFSSVQRHPQNPYHYLLGTSQSLVIMDERFQQNPVLKWCHSLLGPIKYINVVPDALPGDVLVIVGEYKNHEVHCYQYCYGEDALQNVRATGTLGGLPQRSTVNPWKVSPYSDWPNMVDSNNSGIISALNKKLSSPLFGLTCIPFENSLSILQLSKEGDLFYQNFAPTVDKLKEWREDGKVYFYEDVNNDHTASGGCGKGKTVLSKCDQTFVQNWLKTFKHYSNKENLSALVDADSCCINVEDIRCLSNFECESQCALCNPGATSTETIDDNEICFYCGLTRVVSDKLAKVHTNNTEYVVLTKRYLGLTYEYKELKLFDEDKEFCDPLGVNLIKNWYSDEPTPINLGGQTPEDVDVKVEDSIMEDTRNEISKPRINDEANNDFTTSKTTMNHEVNNDLTSTLYYDEVKNDSAPNILESNANTSRHNTIEKSINSQSPVMSKKKKLPRVPGF